MRKLFIILAVTCAVNLSVSLTTNSSVLESIEKGSLSDFCWSWNELLSKTILDLSIPYLADNPRNNEKPIKPSYVSPYAPGGLFRAYYGKGASSAEYKSAILDIIYATRPGVKRKNEDRIRLRKRLYTLAKAGSSEMARKTMGVLLAAVVGDYAQGNEEWEKELCLPHALLKNAKNAIFVEFARLRNEVGESLYGQFLGIGLGSTLAFVIDDTGSMVGEIEAAKKRVNIIINHLQNTLDRPQDFVLVPFNDPSVGPLTVTKDAREFKDALAKLVAHGGGDQAENCLGGIQLAIEASRPGSTLYVITDADAKDFKLQDSVVAQAKQKSIVIVFMLTNNLGYCKRNGGSGRFLKCFNLYQHIANGTGGTVLVVKKDTIFQATEIVQTGIKQGLVVIKRHKLTELDDEILFSVDSSVSEVVVEAQGRCGRLHVRDPYGQVTPLAVVGNLHTVSIPVERKYGEWSLAANGSRSECSVKISAKATEGFILTIWSKPPWTDYSSYRVLKGNPSVTNEIGYLVDYYGADYIRHTDLRVLFITENNEIMGEVKETNFVVTKEGFGNGESFYVVIEGVDTKGYNFSRVVSRLITPSNVTVTCNLDDVIFRPGLPTYVNITVKNNGDNDTFAFGVSDQKKFATIRGKTSHVIGSNQSETFVVQLLSQESTKDGVVSQMTVTARGTRPSSFQYDVCTAVVGEKKRPRVDALTIKGTINSRFAETVVTSVVTNNADVGREAEFNVMLPNDAFIVNMTMKLENQTIVGKVEEKQKAKKVYDKAKKRGKAAGHVAARESSTRVFKTSLFVEPRKNVTFQLTYQQLLRRVRGLYKYQLSINPEQPIKKLHVDVYIVEENPLMLVRVPAFKTEQVNEIADEMPPGTSIVHSHDKRSSHIRYSPSLSEQTQYSPFGLSGTFQVEYDVERTQMYGDITVANGYFAHFFAPPSLRVMPKVVVYVIDTSSSMYGHKMSQVRKALSDALNDLTSVDYFNLVFFNHDVTPWIRYVMASATPTTINDAIGALNEIRPAGGTNILGAFQSAFDLMDPFLPSLPPKANTTEDPLLVVDEQRPSPIPEHYLRIRRMASVTQADVENYAKMMVFLTDGSASIGETDPKQIVERVEEMNGGRVQIHTLGFGSVVKMKMLQQLAGQNNGVSRRVFEELDAASQISDFFEDVTKPLMTDLSIYYSPDRVNDVTKNTFSVFTAGSELVLAGKFNEDENLIDGTTDSIPPIIHSQVRGKTFESNVELDFDIDPYRSSHSILTSQHQIENFAERLWAFLRLKGILQDAILSDNETVTSLLNEQALNMSLKYNFVTPLTSMLVIRSADRLAIEKELRRDKEEELKRKEQERKREKEEQERREKEELVPYYYKHSLPLTLDTALGRGLHGMPVADVAPSRRVLASPGGSSRGGFYGDPHFIIPINDDFNLCFNWDGKDKEIYNLLHDDVTGLTVNGQLIRLPPKKGEENYSRTYISTLAIVIPSRRFKVLISPDKITMLPHGAQNFTLHVTSSMTFTRDGIEVHAYDVTKRTAWIEISSDNMTFYVIQRRHRSTHADHVDFSVSSTNKHLKAQVSGVIGQFLNANVKLRDGRHPQEKVLTLNNRSGRVTKLQRVHPGTRDKVTCWNSHNNARDIIQGTHEHYLVDNMMSPPNYSFL